MRVWRIQGSGHAILRVNWGCFLDEFDLISPSRLTPRRAEEVVNELRAAADAIEDALLGYAYTTIDECEYFKSNGTDAAFLCDGCIKAQSTRAMCPYHSPPAN